MFYRRCDSAASYDGPGCKRPDCACTASYNGKPDEYCCVTCRLGLGLGLGLDPNPNPNPNPNLVLVLALLAREALAA